MDNTDIVWPVQTAIYTKLTGDSALTGKIVGVFDLTAPDDTAFPYVTIGQTTVTPQGAHDRFGARATVTLHVWSVYRGRKETADITADLVRLLDHQPLPLDGHHTVAVRLQQSITVPDTDPDIRHQAVRFAIETENQAA